MVCLGNICRSPTAEAILRKKAKELNLSIQVDSAGTAGYHIGENPVLISIQTMGGHGAGRSTKQTIQEQTDKWSFMFFNMGIKPTY